MLCCVDSNKTPNYNRLKVEKLPVRKWALVFFVLCFLQKLVLTKLIITESAKAPFLFNLITKSEASLLKTKTIK